MRTVKIVDIAEQIRGVSYNPEDVFDTAQENTVPLLRANNIQDTGLNYDDLVYVQKSKVSPKQLLRQGDILVCASSGSRHLVGKAGHVYNDFGTFGAFCKVLRPNAQLVNSNYFAHYFQSPLYRRTIANLAAGANINNIKNEHLNELQIKLPCLQEQNIIARVLDKTNAIIGKRRAQLSCLNELAKSRFIEMFGDPVTNPKGWESGTIRDIASEVKYGTSSPATEGGKHIYLRMNNITYDGHLDLSNLKYIDLPDDQLAKYQVQKGDVLFNRTNSKELVGKTCVFKEDIPMVIAGYIIRVRVNARANPEYLSAILNSKYGKRTLLDMCKAIVGQANINAQELQNIDILIPPISLQNEFATFIEELDKSKFTIRKSLEKLETLYRALLQEYFG